MRRRSYRGSVRSGFASGHSPAGYYGGWLHLMNTIKGILERGEQWQAPELAYVRVDDPRLPAPA